MVKDTVLMPHGIYLKCLSSRQTLTSVIPLRLSSVCAGFRGFLRIFFFSDFIWDLTVLTLVSAIPFCFFFFFLAAT